MYTPAILLLDNQFHGLFSVIGFETHEIDAVLQMADVDCLKVFTDVQHTLAHDVEHFYFGEASTFDVKHVLGRVRIDLSFLAVFWDGIRN